MSTDGLTWRTSSYSGSQENCVQIAADGATTHVRDSKNPAGATLTVSTAAFATLLRTVRAGGS